MKLASAYLVPAVLLSMLAVGCGEKEAPPPPAPAPVAAPAAVAPVGAAPSTGGYEPTAAERIPGITLPANAVATPVAGTAPAEAPAATPAAPATAK